MGKEEGSRGGNYKFKVFLSVYSIQWYMRKLFILNSRKSYLKGIGNSFWYFYRDGNIVSFYLVNGYIYSLEYG